MLNLVGTNDDEQWPGKSGYDPCGGTNKRDWGRSSYDGWSDLWCDCENGKQNPFHGIFFKFFGFVVLYTFWEAKLVMTQDKSYDVLVKKQISGKQNPF